MSLAQVSALTLYDGAPEFMKRAQYIGLQTTNSASSDVTDSAAAATVGYRDQNPKRHDQHDS